MSLTGPQIQQLQDALLSAFPTRGALEQMVRFHLDQRLDAIVGGQNQTEVVYNLISWAEAQDQTAALIAGARAANPGNVRLRETAAQLTSAAAGQPAATTSLAQEGSAALFTREGRRQLIDLLLRLPNSGDAAARNLLLAGLPSALQQSVPFSNVPATHIAQIVDTVTGDAWRQLPDGTRPVEIVIENAMDTVRGTQMAQQLHDLLNRVPVRNEPRAAAPAPTAPPPAPRSTTARPPVDFVIITALEEERDAVLAQLPEPRQLPPSREDVRVYHWATVPAPFAEDPDHRYRVVVTSLLNMGRVEAANATGDAIRRWQPRYVLLVGIAGGIAESDVKLGDILVSDQVVDYELQKITTDGPKVRYSVHRADPRLLGAAQNLPATAWQARVAVKRPRQGTPRRLIGPVATGDKVISFKEVLDAYRADWPKVIGVEMEAGGAASAAFQAATPPGFFMIRGVSDLADAAKDAPQVRAWREYACTIAAVYAVALLQSAPVPADTRV